MAQRAELVRTLLSGKAKPSTIRLAEVALAGFGGRSFSNGLTRLVELAADRRDRQVAYVTVAAPLGEDEERRLSAKLTELYGREVTVKQTVDPAGARRAERPGRCRSLRRHHPAPTHRNP